MSFVKINQWITAMAKLFNAIRNLRVRELEGENKIFREKLAWRGPWMF
jgi:hypothetical protein